METRPGRASDSFSIRRCVGNSTCARLLMNRLPSTVHAGGFQHVDFFQQRGRIDHQAVADHGLLAGPQNAAGNQLQHELALADKHGVAGVMPALVAGHDVEAFGEEVDDLPLAFVAPLGAQDDYVAHDWPNAWVLNRCEETAPSRSRLSKPGEIITSVTEPRPSGSGPFGSKSPQRLSTPNPSILPHVITLP